MKVCVLRRVEASLATDPTPLVSMAASSKERMKYKSVGVQDEMLAEPEWMRELKS